VTSTWQPVDPLAQIPRSARRGEAGFVEDVLWAARVCARQPLLPVLTLALGLAPLVYGGGSRTQVSDGAVTATAPSPGQQAVTSVIGLVLLLLLGFPGTQRLWFLRAATGRRLTAGEVLPLTFRYFGRFFVLGCVFFGLALVFALPAVIDYARTFEVDAAGSVTVGTAGWPALLVAAAGTVVLDVLFTFVTPAIVFSSHRVRDALRIGWRLLRATWPAGAAYVFVPPFAAVVMALYSGLRPAVSVPLVVLATAVNLLVKGATAAYYLRLVRPAGEDGSLVLSPPRVDYTWQQGW
jgi:hypothetical protein